MPNNMADYGIDRKTLLDQNQRLDPYVVFLHGTTWESKHWPASHWRSLAKIALQNGLKVKLKLLL